MSDTPAKPPTAPANFLRTLIEQDLASGAFAGRRFGGSPGDAAHHAAGAPDPARIRTRFPPEPNGYLHIGHAKSICLNFGLARDYGGVCHLRFDDTNPEKEEQEYVDAIIEMVHWLGFDWETDGTQPPVLRQQLLRLHVPRRRDPGRARPGLCRRADAPSRCAPAAATSPRPAPTARSAAARRHENLARLREMRDGLHADGAMVLRAKIDMASPNINLRDPALYRIKRAHHHNTGDRWCIYPMYTYAHPIEDALEGITHSFCTLEFEDQRPFYDWLLDHLADAGPAGAAAAPAGRVRSPEPDLRHHQQAQAQGPGRRGHRAGLGRPAHAHAGRPAPARLHAGVDPQAGRRHRRQQDQHLARLRACSTAPARRPRRPGAARDGGARPAAAGAEQLGRTLRRRPPRALPGAGASAAAGTAASAASSSGPRSGSSATTSPKRRPRASSRLLSPGNKVRLKYGMVIECTGCEKDADGRVTRVLATVLPDTKSGTPGADAVKVKGTITWVGAHDALPAERAPVRPPVPRAAARRRRARLPRGAEPATACASGAAGWNRRWPAGRRSARSSSSATATSSPTARTTAPRRRCSTGSPD